VSVVVSVVLALEEQPARRASIISAASARERNFFIVTNVLLNDYLALYYQISLLK
jgi:hypothetical protein